MESEFLVIETRKCKDCGSAFDITLRSREFYKTRGLELPKRCTICRRKRQLVREAAAAKQLHQDLLDRQIAEKRARIAVITTQLEALKSGRALTHKMAREVTQ